MSTTKVQIVSQEDYLPARLRLLEKEKKWSKARDELNKERKALPLVEVSKTYKFTSMDESGKEQTYTLEDLFDGRGQLIIYHAMFDPEWNAACPSCSLLLEGYRHAEHLASVGTTLVVVSRASNDKIQAYRKRMGWTFPWYSSQGSDFNYDFNVTIDPDKNSSQYNFRDIAEWKEKGATWFTRGEQPGHSAFVKGNSKEGVGEDGKIYHNYSSYARAGEVVIPIFGWMDMTFKGRQVPMKGDGIGFKRKDEYTDEDLKGS